MLSPERNDVLEIDQSREVELGSQWGQTKETENNLGCQDKFDTEAKEKQRVSSVTYARSFGVKDEIPSRLGKFDGGLQNWKWDSGLTRERQADPRMFLRD